MKPLATFLFGLVWAFAVPAARAQSNAGLMVLPWEEGQSVEGSVNGYFFKSSPTRDASGTDLTLTRTVGLARYRLDPENPQSSAIGYRYVQMELGTDFAGLPNRLVHHSMAYGFHLGRNADGWITTAQVGVGFAGDLPMSDSDAWFGYGNLIWTKPVDENTVRRIILEYNGNRTFTPDIPLPGFVEFKRVNEQVQYALGLPYSGLFWRDEQTQTRGELSFYFPRNIKGRIETNFTKDLTLYTEVQNSFEAYHVSGMPENRRLFFTQRRVEAGMEWRPQPQLEFVLAGGWAFGREYSTGWDSRDLNTVTKIAGGPYIRLGLDFDF